MSDRVGQDFFGLVLSGGAARGLVHIGVLSVLEEYGIGIDLIVGASFGAIVAAYFAAGYSTEEMLDYARRFRLWSLLDFRAPWRGMFSGEKVQRLFEQGLGLIGIEDLGIPVIVLAADLEREEPVLLERGRLSTALRASSAFPGLFPPVRIGGRLLTDGGIVDSVATDIARKKGAGFVLASDVSLLSDIYAHPLQSELLKKAAEKASSKRPFERKISLPAVMRSTLRIIHRYRPGEGRNPECGADVSIAPICGEIRPLCFRKVDEGYRIGREAAMRVIDSVAGRVRRNAG
ncbi:MAG: patatin-like phospholipase family protein [Spirochaetes bacterium]|nr:patatin-like phospholipase family protein [Spirochaetota bacterium]